MKFHVRRASAMSKTEQVELSSMEELKELHERLSDGYCRYPLIITFDRDLSNNATPNENEIVVYDDYIE